MTLRPPRLRQIGLAVIGPGPLWEGRYRSALAALETRVAVKAVYDPVHILAQQVARTLSAEPVDSLHGLFERADVQAVAVFDVGWLGLAPLRQALRSQKPLFLAGRFLFRTDEIAGLHAQVLETGLPVMTEFAGRHTPTTCRLMELMATRLGFPQEIQVQGARLCSPTEVQREGLVGLLDWCLYVAGRPPCRVTAITPVGRQIVASTTEIGLTEHEASWHGFGGEHDADGSLESAAAGEVELVFRRIGRFPELKIRIQFGVSDSESADWGGQKKLRCEQGTAVVDGVSGLSWVTGDSECRESLGDEKTAEQRMLDLFLRRVAGGLVPVSDLGAAIIAVNLSQSIRAAFSTRT